MGTFKDLLVWQKSMELARQVHRATSSFPHEEKFGLVSQMRRCAVSIPSNISEGYGRDSKGEQAYFLQISRGSSNELGTQTTLAHEFGYIDDEDNEQITELNDEVNKMLNSLIYTLKH